MTRFLFALAALIALLACPSFVGAQDEKEAKPKPDSPSAFLPTIPEWKVVDGPDEYMPENLYDLIDGEAEAFIGYGFVKAVTVILESENSTAGLEWRLYDMATKLNAFGIYQIYAPSDAKELKAGTAGLIKDEYAAFYLGKYFVQVEGLSGSEGEAEAAAKLAADTAKMLPQDTKPPSELHLFPPKDLVKESIRYTPQGALGYQFLKGAMEARYLSKGAKESVKAFVLQRSKVEDARKAFNSYREFLEDKGKGEIEEVFMGETALRSVDPYHGNIFLVKAGRWVVGVAGPHEWSDLQSLARDILKTAVGKRGKRPTKQQE